ncbi:hypothetical protein H8S23_07995 [Anaerofilum sp. BX8]|uniref:Acyl-ACP thioesterase n=1 Tax=Anaerofilum hominis TaxID=2763016 RepID=A0A923KW35_9FIRM|nr:acyl-ACP thioesterase domain-containing protein [Anaerofilum hominis]MBC5581451.1 hypothetical protein [Anaerofilum hominis]
MEIATYTKDILIEQTECDLKNRMTLGALLRRAQQAATGHCDAVGVTTSYLLGYHTAFLLVKASVETMRDLRPGEKLRIVTEPSAPAHAFYNRFTSFYGEDGALAAAVDSRWVLADTDSRRVLRRPPEGLVIPFFERVEKEQDVSVVRAQVQEDAGQATAVYSRVDLNGHLNNTYYGDILCDALPAEVWLGERGFRKAVLAYRVELPLGQTMALARGRADYHGAPCWYVEGVREGARCFEGNILF